MPLRIIRDDITKVECDAIVNAANSSLLGGGGVDGAIHRAAGPGLLEECRGLGGCEVGQAKATGAYALPAKYVIHTVGPIWAGGRRGEREKLASCYRESLLLADSLGCESVAFPLISTGVYSYPKEEALAVAVAEIVEFLTHHDMEVTIVVFDRDSFGVSKKLIDEVKEYVDENYVGEHTDSAEESRRRGMFAFLKKKSTAKEAGSNAAPEKECGDVAPFVMMQAAPQAMPPMTSPAANAARAEEAVAEKAEDAVSANESVSAADTVVLSAPHTTAQAVGHTLGEALASLDESFSEMLLRKIDERGITDAACYKKANVDRKLFSKIRGDRLYKPSKPTAIAFAIALELPLEEARDLLMKAGFAFSHSSKFDVIVEYFIREGRYDVFEINEALFEFDQPLLGA